jgi:hypothetical protein
MGVLTIESGPPDMGGVTSIGNSWRLGSSDAFGNSARCAMTPEHLR